MKPSILKQNKIQNIRVFFHTQSTSSLCMASFPKCLVPPPHHTPSQPELNLCLCVCLESLFFTGVSSEGVTLQWCVVLCSVVWCVRGRGGLCGFLITQNLKQVILLSEVETWVKIKSAMLTLKCKLCLYLFQADLCQSVFNSKPLVFSLLLSVAPL